MCTPRATRAIDASSGQGPQNSVVRAIWNEYSYHCIASYMYRINQLRADIFGAKVVACQKSKKTGYMYSLQSCCYVY